MNTSVVSVSQLSQNNRELQQQLGSFWHKTVQDPEFAKRITDALGLQATQLSLLAQESTDLLNRNKAPALHRERTLPVTIYQSEKDAANAALFTIGSELDTVIGTQTAPIFTSNTVLDIGGASALNGIVSYIMHPAPDNIITAVSNGLDNAAEVYLRDVDFIIRGNGIFFFNGIDPFTRQGFAKESYIRSATEAPDTALTLHCTDAVIDVDYVNDYLAYPLALKMSSTPANVEVINRLWDLHNGSATDILFNSAVAAVFKQPIVQNDYETVETIIQEAGVTKVITDSNVYSLPVLSLLRSDIQVGKTLTKGEFISSAIRIYSNINIGNTVQGDIQRDVAALFLGKNMLAAQVAQGVGFDWELRDIICYGFDAHGNPKLGFKVSGSQADQDAFWNYFWSDCEKKNVSSATCFSGYLDDTLITVENDVYGRVRPMEYLFKYFFKYNTIIVVIDSAKLGAFDLDSSYVALSGMIEKLVPAHARVIYVITQAVPAEEYDAGTNVDENVSQLHVQLRSEWATAGVGSSILTYRDSQPIMRWIAANK